MAFLNQASAWAAITMCNCEDKLVDVEVAVWLEPLLHFIVWFLIVLT